jgi:hypothetical protein
VSRLALTPTNVPASATAISTPTLRAGDLYYNTSTGLMVYTGSAWSQVSSNVTISEIDAGVFDSIAPYNGGDPTTSATQSFEGGTP